MYLSVVAKCHSLRLTNSRYDDHSMHRLYFCIGFLRIHLVPRFRIGSKAHLAKTGAAPMETPILTGNRACSLAHLLP
jgi:hypothetical protein